MKGTRLDNERLRNIILSDQPERDVDTIALWQTETTFPLLQEVLRQWDLVIAGSKPFIDNDIYHEAVNYLKRQPDSAYYAEGGTVGSVREFFKTHANLLSEEARTYLEQEILADPALDTFDSQDENYQLVHSAINELSEAAKAQIEYHAPVDLDKPEVTEKTAEPEPEPAQEESERATLQQELTGLQTALEFAEGTESDEIKELIAGIEVALEFLPEEKAKGGFVGKGELVWNKVGAGVKLEFLIKNFTPEITPRTQEDISKRAYNFVPKNVKIKWEAKYANKDAGEYAKGGKVNTPEPEIYTDEHGNEVKGFVSTWNSGAGKFEGKPVVYGVQKLNITRDNEMYIVVSGIKMSDNELVNTSEAYDDWFTSEQAALSVAHELATNENAFAEEFAKGGGLRLGYGKRTYNSPLIRYVNFNDGSYINIVRLTTAYADGRKYSVVYAAGGATKDIFAFKTLEQAEKRFEQLQKERESTVSVKNKGVLLGNYEPSGQLPHNWNALQKKYKEQGYIVKLAKGGQLKRSDFTLGEAQRLIAVAEAGQPEKAIAEIEEYIAVYENSEDKSPRFGRPLQSIIDEYKNAIAYIRQNVGKIKNQYAGKTAEQVWDSWDPAQRAHFIDDHDLNENVTDKTLKQTAAQLKAENFGEAFGNATKWGWIENLLIEHVLRGQYAKGGKFVAGKIIEATYRDADNYKYPVKFDLPKNFRYKVGDDVPVSDLGIANKKWHTVVEDLTGTEWNSDRDHYVVEINAIREKQPADTTVQDWGYAKGGHPARNLSRDRMFRSQQEWEKNLDRKTPGKRYKEDGGVIIDTEITTTRDIDSDNVPLELIPEYDKVDGHVFLIHGSFGKHYYEWVGGKAGKLVKIDITSAKNKKSKGGHPARNLSRDRMFRSQQEWEKNRKRRTKAKKYKRALENGGEAGEEKYYTVSLYFKDDPEEILEGYTIKDGPVVESEDDDIFFYATEADIKEMMKPDNEDYDFVVTEYELDDSSFAKGGHPARNLSRDRKFISQQEWEKNLDRKTPGKRYKADGGSMENAIKAGTKYNFDVPLDKEKPHGQQHSIIITATGEIENPGEHWFEGDDGYVYLVHEEELNGKTPIKNKPKKAAGGKAGRGKKHDYTVSPGKSFDLCISRALATDLLKHDPENITGECFIMCAEAAAEGKKWAKVDKKMLVQGQLPPKYKTFELWISGDITREQLQQAISEFKP